MILRINCYFHKTKSITNRYSYVLLSSLSILYKKSLATLLSHRFKLIIFLPKPSLSYRHSLDHFSLLWYKQCDNNYDKLCCIILASSEVSCEIIYHHSFDSFNPHLYFEFFLLIFFTQDELQAVTILIVQSMLWSRRDRPRANFPEQISQTNLKDAPHKYTGRK